MHHPGDVLLLVMYRLLVCMRYFFSFLPFRQEQHEEINGKNFKEEWFAIIVSGKAANSICIAESFLVL